MRILLEEKSIGFMFRNPTRARPYDPPHTAPCPFCEKALNPSGNIQTHTVLHPSGELQAFYRAHKSCTSEALPTDLQACDVLACARAEEVLKEQRALEALKVVH